MSIIRLAPPPQPKPENPEPPAKPVRPRTRRPLWDGNPALLTKLRPPRRLVDRAAFLLARAHWRMARNV